MDDIPGTGGNPDVVAKTVIGGGGTSYCNMSINSNHLGC